MAPMASYGMDDAIAVSAAVAATVTVTIITTIVPPKAAQERPQMLPQLYELVHVCVSRIRTLPLPVPRVSMTAHSELGRCKQYQIIHGTFTCYGGGGGGDGAGAVYSQAHTVHRPSPL
ncbi:hypothetical protein EDC01DRAFT_633697 [Geopyxis carbonaria]|nr:hypothetical protein EDC01DRAFT_633697 [Geopyxis carbonaria]